MDERFIKVIVAETDILPKKVTESTHLWDDLGLDSFDVLELIMTVEEEYGIEVTDEEWEKQDPKTVGDFWKMVEGKINEKSGT